MNKKLAYTSAIATLSFGAIMAFSAPSHATGMLEACKANSAGKVENCCTSWVRRNGLPFWMESADSCSSVRCSGYGKGNYCYITVENGPNTRESKGSRQSLRGGK